MTLFSQCTNSWGGGYGTGWMRTRSVDFHGSVGAGSQLHNSKAVAYIAVCSGIYYYTILYSIRFVVVVVAGAVITGMTSTKMRRRSCADDAAARKKLKLHLTSRGIGLGLSPATSYSNYARSAHRLMDSE